MSPLRLLLLFVVGFVSTVSSAAIDNVNPAAWALLSKAVDGRLYTEAPLAKPCYPQYNGALNVPDAAKCKEVQDGYKNDTYLVTQPSGYLNTNWDNRTGVPLVVKNSGHDYKGRSSAPNSLKLWTYNLQPPIALRKGFVAAGCKKNSATDGVFMGAEDNGITIVGGSSPTVGTAGGWITGAGHSSISNLYGLSVDNVLEMEVVTGTGQVLTASRCQNPELFAAMRGGGGATFGVIMSVTTKAQPKLRIQVAYVRFVSPDLDNVRQFLQILIANGVQLAKDGWGGYIEPNAMSKQASGFVLFTPKFTKDQAIASMKPIMDWVAKPGKLVLDNRVEERESFKKAYDEFLVPNEELVGLGTAIGSRLIPTDNFAPNRRQELLNALMSVVSTVDQPFPLAEPRLYTYGAPLQFLVTSPYNYGKGDGMSTETPAWRNSLWHVFINSAFSNQATAAQISTAFQRSHSAAEVLHQDPIGAFWGTANYQRLLTYKKRFDPYNLLTNHQAVGWNPNDPMYSCYPPAP